MGRRFDSGGGLHIETARQAESSIRPVVGPSTFDRRLPEICQLDVIALSRCMVEDGTYRDMGVG
jgi:hypothetical protein